MNKKVGYMYMKAENMNTKVGYKLEYIQGSRLDKMLVQNYMDI